MSGLVRLLIVFVPFRRWAPYLSRGKQEAPREQDVAELAAAKRIGRMIETVSRHTPWESKCLVQATVGKLMLRRRGINNTLYLGVGKDPKELLIAHAWLKCGGVIITGGHDLERFAAVGSFSDRVGN